MTAITTTPIDASLGRVILYVQDVSRLVEFYTRRLGLSLSEEVKNEWAVLKAGRCELALHRVGPAYRVEDPKDWKVESNVKLVMRVSGKLEDARAALIAQGVPMGEIKSYPGFSGKLCDGRDPEGNVFQLEEPL